MMRCKKGAEAPVLVWGTGLLDSVVCCVPATAAAAAAAFSLLQELTAACCCQCYFLACEEPVQTIVKNSGCGCAQRAPMACGSMLFQGDKFGL